MFLLGMKSFLMRKSHDDGHAFEGSGLSRAVSIAVISCSVCDPYQNFKSFKRK